MAETSCQSLRMLSDQRALSAQAVVSRFVKKTLNSKNTRRLQTLSIQHCITRRLRAAFSSFKKLLSRTVRLTARDWHRHRFLSSVFGRWLTYVNDEKHIESTLLGQGYSFFRMVRFKQLRTAYHRSQVRRQNCHRRIRLGISYFSYLSLLRSFETLTVRKQAKCSARSSYYSAERLHYSKCASRVIFSFIETSKNASRLRATDQYSAAHAKRYKLKKYLALLMNHAAMRVCQRQIDQVISDKFEVSLVTIEKRVQLIWRTVMARRAIAAFKKFRRKRELFIGRKCTVQQLIRDVGVNIAHRSKEHSDRPCWKELYFERDVTVAILRYSVRQWTAASRRMSRHRPGTALATLHWTSKTHYLRLSKVITAIQKKRRRSFIEDRRMSLAAVTHRHRQLRGGLRNLAAFVVSSRGVAAMRMTGDFRSEMRRIIQGYSCLKKHVTAQSDLRHGLIKSITMWKVRRLYLAVRTLCQWATHRRQRRCMLLEARSCYEQEVKRGACRLFLTAAAHHMRSDREYRMRMIAVKAARKWRSVVCRNKVMRSRGVNPSTPPLPLSLSPFLSDGTESTSYLPTPLTPHSHGDSHSIPLGNVSNLLRAKPRYLDSAEHYFTPPRDSRKVKIEVEVEIVPTPAVRSDRTKSTHDLESMNRDSRKTSTSAPATASSSSSSSAAAAAAASNHFQAAPLKPLLAFAPGITDPRFFSNESHQGLAYAAPRRLSMQSMEMPSPTLKKSSQENGTDSKNNVRNIQGLGNDLEMKMKTRRKNKELLAQEILNFISEVRGAR